MQRYPGQQQRADKGGAANDVDNLLPPDMRGDCTDIRRGDELAHGAIFEALYGCGSMPNAASAVPTATITGCRAMTALCSVTYRRAARNSDNGRIASILASKV